MEAQPRTKPGITRNDLLLLGPYDAWIYRDWSSHPAAKLADLLSLPAWEVIKKHGL
jgi:hypothetical protein